MRLPLPVALAATVILSAAAGGCDSDTASQPPAAATSTKASTTASTTASTDPAPSAAPSPTLVTPDVDQAAAVIATNAGSGTMSRPRSFRTRGSYMFSATCSGGSEATVVTSDRSRTPVPCTGLTSRMRFVATSGVRETYRVVAPSSVDWMITWTDYDPSR